MKSVSMKHLNAIAGLVLMCLSMSCAKEIVKVDDDGRVEERNGVTKDDFQQFQGEIGMVFDAREMAKLGYLPAKLVITTDAKLGNYSQTIDLDPVTLLGQIKLAVADLSQEALTELQSTGINLKVDIQDAAGKAIGAQELHGRNFSADPAPLTLLPGGLKDLNTEVNLKPNTPYYMQVLDKDGNPSTRALKYYSHPDYLSLTTGSGYEFTGKEDNAIFYFRPLESVRNGYVIYNKQARKTLGRLRVLFADLIRIDRPAGILDPAQVSEAAILANPNIVFVIEKESPGVYLIKMRDGSELKEYPGTGIVSDLLLPSEKLTSFRVRFIAMDVIWDVTSVETRYLRPVMPKVKTEFGVNTTLVNCGSGPLVQNIGSSISKSVSVSVGWEEALSFSTTHSNSFTTSIGMTVEGSFFGNGASYSADFEHSYTYTTTAEKSSSNWGDEATSDTEEFFISRDVTVPPKSASLVYDVMQVYERVSVHYVQRLQVRGTNANAGLPNRQFTGEEIVSMLQFSRFTGVVTFVGPDYVEITMRGVAGLGNLIETRSEVREVDAGC